ncbi:MAG: UV DNA damage repair endonuclease UvsE [Candidatus Zixiibacteriota bacterium]|nr:MAG: UV DNA damage repair endonuclease UvsE [candidate division Zixibacteria bacterium]
MNRTRSHNLRLGLCCIFRDQPIKFRTTTARALSRLTRRERQKKLSELCFHNAEALMQSLEFCTGAGIGAFRILSQIMPLRTHPDFGYDLTDLAAGDAIRATFARVKEYAGKNNIRLSFHPDQFVVLNSPREDIVASSIGELVYQSEVADRVGADVVNIHGGGAYGNKTEALKRFEHTFLRLPEQVRRLLTIENDDRVYSPSDLLPLCESVDIPLVYDVHHHRCLPDELNIDEATRRALATWNREPLFHISSPIDGWNGRRPERHHDYIDINDVPEGWCSLKLTVEVEAKAKELAVVKLADELCHPGRP